MSKKKVEVELTETEKKRIARIKEIIDRNKALSNENKEVVDETLEKVKESFDEICDIILFNCNEIQRAIIAEILVQTLLLRATLTGFILAGLLEHLRQRLITQPLISRRVIGGKQFMENAIANLLQSKKNGDITYIR